jgi:N-acetylglucosaminyl-diphospho-decaprenol L-rhamnosyltransferase
VSSGHASPPSVDVVILAYQHWELTEKCLQLLARQTVRHSAIVVDNGSTDGTADNLRRTFPDVEVVELAQNGGLPFAYNRGVEHGTGEIVVMLNNDIEVRADFLEQLIEPFVRNPRLGSAAALLVQPGGQNIDSMGLTVDRTLAGFPRLRGHPVRDAAEPSPVLTGPCGGGGAYRRTAWEAVAGLDEGVRFYGEDVDLALRIRSAGWETIAVPEAVAVHLGSATLGKGSAWQRRQSGFARGYFMRRYRIPSGRAGLRALVTESLVVVGDAVLCRDLNAVRGRLAGWRSARSEAARERPPAAAIDDTIGFLESLRLRRRIVFGGNPSAGGGRGQDGSASSPHA